MKLFKTTTRRTSYRPKSQRVGYVHTVKAKTRLKRWARRTRKKLWRKAKVRTKRLWRSLTPQRQARKRRITRNAQQFRRHHAKIHAGSGHPESSYQSDAEGQVKLPPPDGATSTCRRCANEVQYNGARERWEHPGRGNWECFQPHR